MMHLLGQMPGIYVQAGPRTQTWANRAFLDYAFTPCPFMALNGYLL